MNLFSGLKGEGMTKEIKTVTISKKEYEELLDDSLFLNCLRNNGVDNWDWYDEAVEEYQQIKGEE